ncbi:hypothetical protein JZ751_028282 [Albula glossodonta]|uniref:G-protein coupled receptors family 1 profile domain-containing protein n=1 Tax=Albula glossodonta TaxID=121402 RepID=A0A8T2MPN0_9TELE|nr:hypothetical protein JZ751_004695 [Albula glossodonta]KAG9330005.1 hypothetical protein JZ751_028282 [Albula glossodonta]
METAGDHRKEFQALFLPPVFGVELCVALLGNMAALWLMGTRERRQNWHTGLVFSCNLAVSDLLYALTLPLLVLYYAGGKHWRFGAAACTAERFLFTCNLYGSILFVTCISVNRYVAIVHPFFTRNHVQPKHAVAVSILVWVVVVAMSSPVLRFAGECRQQNTTAKANASIECVSACEMPDQWPHLVYSVSLAAVGCMLPFLVTLASYAGLFRVVWRNENITALEKRKVALMVGSVVVLYAISFVPYHVLKNYHYYLKLYDKGTAPVYRAYQVTKGLVTLNMCIHPLLYMGALPTLMDIGSTPGEEEENGVLLSPTLPFLSFTLILTVPHLQPLLLFPIPPLYPSFHSLSFLQSLTCSHSYSFLSPHSTLPFIHSHSYSPSPAATLTLSYPPTLPFLSFTLILTVPHLQPLLLFPIPPTPEVDNSGFRK